MQRAKELAIIWVLLFATVSCGCSTEKSENMEVGNKMGNSFFSSIIDRIRGDAPKQDVQDHRNENGEGFHVDEGMRYAYLSDNDEETKLAVKVVKKALVPKSKWTYEAYPRFKIGNMAFIEIHDIPTVFITDLNKQPYFVVVVLGVDPHMVRTPDKELFVKFMNAVRADPDLMTPPRRLRAAMILATGGVGEYIDEDGFEPSWTDEDGVLVIQYHTYIRRDNGMIPPIRVACTLTVDENQDFILESLDVDDE